MKKIGSKFKKQMRWRILKAVGHICAGGIDDKAVAIHHLRHLLLIVGLEEAATQVTNMMDAIKQKEEHNEKEAD